MHWGERNYIFFGHYTLEACMPNFEFEYFLVKVWLAIKEYSFYIYSIVVQIKNSFKKWEPRSRRPVEIKSWKGRKSTAHHFQEIKKLKCRLKLNLPQAWNPK